MFARKILFIAALLMTEPLFAMGNKPPERYTFNFIDLVVEYRQVCPDQTATIATYNDQYAGIDGKLTAVDLKMSESLISLAYNYRSDSGLIDQLTGAGVLRRGRTGFELAGPVKLVTYDLANGQGLREEVAGTLYIDLNAQTAVLEYRRENDFENCEVDLNYRFTLPLTRQ